MRVRGIGRLQKTGRWLRNKFVRGALILLYHRVAELSSDPQLLSVTPQYFSEHLDVLHTNYHPMSLHQLVQAVRDENVPPRAVAITFDDGYADNLYKAKPLLERYEIPATVFVATGYTGQSHEFWWDELDRLLLQPGLLPQTLHLNINGCIYQWELGEAATYSKNTYHCQRNWHVLAKDIPGPRQHLYHILFQKLRSLSEKERRSVINTLLAWADAQPTGRLTHRALSASEVFQLAEGELVEAGAHTVTHPVLSTIPTSVQRAEIKQSKIRLEEILGRPVIAFSYPYGSQSDYTAETVSIVRNVGFDCACANFPDIVWRKSSPFQLPRILVRNWGGEEFNQRLEAWFGN